MHNSLSTNQLSSATKKRNFCVYGIMFTTVSDRNTEYWICNHYKRKWKESSEHIIFLDTDHEFISTWKSFKDWI